MQAAWILKSAQIGPGRASTVPSCAKPMNARSHACYTFPALAVSAADAAEHPKLNCSAAASQVGASVHTIVSNMSDLLLSLAELADYCFCCCASTTFAVSVRSESLSSSCVLIKTRESCCAKHFRSRQVHPVQMPTGCTHSETISVI